MLVSLKQSGDLKLCQDPKNFNLASFVHTVKQLLSKNSHITFRELSYLLNLTLEMVIGL